MIKTQTHRINNDDVTINLHSIGEGPLILCVHGWPELWYSWRHQMEHFAERGYKVAAMDVRGYGHSDKPHEIEHYTMKLMTADVAKCIDALGDGHAILFGHDWGAPIVWNTSILFPQKVRAVAGLSVPHLPVGEKSLLELSKERFKDQFFYQHYFLPEGIAEAEFEADVAKALRMTYFSSSGDSPVLGGIGAKRPLGAKFLDELIDPEEFPNWLTQEDLNVYVRAFEKSGFRGPFNRYRAQQIDFEELPQLQGALVNQPSYFIGGGSDSIRNLLPGRDLYETPGYGCTDFKGSTIIPNVGHWVQQEAPQQTNQALEIFLELLG